MVTGGLPEDGEARLGPVMLPAGRRVIPHEVPGEPVAWVTTEAVFYPGLKWSELSDMREQTGLVPVVLADDPGPDFGGLFFYAPDDVSQADHLDPAQVVAALWGDRTSPDDDEVWAAEYAPFSAQFPGLAPPGDAPLSKAQLLEVISALPAARIGLVPARRPADVLPTVGWVGPDCQYPDNLSIAAILRSWEDRFGARLLRIGPGAEIQLLVERPPRSLQSAQRIAAEHFAFCDECGGQGLRQVGEIAASLLGAPTWTFWWD